LVSEYFPFDLTVGDLSWCTLYWLSLASRNQLLLTVVKGKYGDKFRNDGRKT
jgi:hypothetical protein